MSCTRQRRCSSACKVLHAWFCVSSCCEARGRKRRRRGEGDGGTRIKLWSEEEVDEWGQGGRVEATKTGAGRLLRCATYKRHCMAAPSTEKNLADSADRRAHGRGRYFEESFPQKLTMSSVESSTAVVPFVAMQRRSLMASTAPKAQQEPQVLCRRGRRHGGGGAGGSHGGIAHLVADVLDRWAHGPSSAGVKGHGRDVLVRVVGRGGRLLRAAEEQAGS